MKQYKFRLETVLQIREREETIARNDFFIINQEYLHVLHEIERLKVEQYQVLYLCHGYNVNDAAIFANYRMKLLHDIEEYEKKLQILQKKQEKLKKNYIEIKKNTEILKKLKEKSMVEYRKEFQKYEQKEIDNITSYIYN